MRVLLNIGHPADVHFSRFAVMKLKANGHEALLTRRIKDLTTELREGFGLAHYVLNRKGRGAFDLLFELLQRDFELAVVARRFSRPRARRFPGDA